MKVVMSVGFRSTACGHNDFCSVRLNGPIWWFILTHKYRLSLSHFTEAVMIESATQTVPRRKIAMNTLMSGMGVPCTGTLRASVLSDSWAFGALATNCLMRALVPLGEKSSESVPERVLPYRHIGMYLANQNLAGKEKIWEKFYKSVDRGADLL